MDQVALGVFPDPFCPGLDLQVFFALRTIDKLIVSAFWKFFLCELFPAGCAGKRNDYEVWSNFPVCLYIMEFIGFMKDDLSLL